VTRTSTPCVSVALATYNGASFLPAQLASIAAQSRRPDEVVIGDDQSSDGTEEEVQCFARKTGIPVRFTRNQKRLGSSVNFANILMRCEGDVILLSDQDDVWAPDRISTSLAALQAHPNVGFVFSDAGFISESGSALPGSLWQRVFFSRKQRRLFREGHPWQVLLKSNVVTGATMAIRRAVLSSALPIPRGWVHDGWLALMISLQHGGWPIERRLISYRIHSAQQIGVVRWKPAALLALVRKQNAGYLRGEAANFRALADRLRVGSLVTAPPALSSFIDAAHAKADFLERRADGREDLSAFVRGVGRSLASGSYSRHGLGFKALLFDVVGALDAATSRRFGADSARPRV
jgi:glycosyltransferase involved in cell wall biosynthesis